MKDDKHKPFSADVEEFGRYQYTDVNRLSCVMVNRRFSDMIIASTDFKGKRVVDVGCGDGTYTNVLRNETQAAFILGVDPSEKAIDVAKQCYGSDPEQLDFFTGYASDLLEKDRHFDVAVYRGVLHHVPDQAEEIATACKLADTVVILEPNGWNPVLKALEKFSRYHREHEEQSFTLGTFRKWIYKTGGQIASARYFGLVPIFCPDWFARFAKALETIIERIPIIRTVSCGQILITISTT